MDQYVDNRQKEILWDLLANPADNGASYIHSLERLVRDNPQSGLLQVLLARTGDKQQLSKAAVYYNPRTLYKIVNHPAELAAVEAESITGLAQNTQDAGQNFFNAGTIAGLEGIPAPLADDEATLENAFYADTTQAEVINAPDKDTADETAEAPQPEIEQALVENDHTPPSQPEIETETEEPVEEIAEVPQLTEEQAPVKSDNTDEQTPETAAPQQPEETPQIFAGLEPVEEETESVQIAETPAPQANTNIFRPRFPRPEAPVNRDTPEPEYPKAEQPQPEQPQNDIEDDIYDEIVGIEDIGFEHSAPEKQSAAEPLTEARFSVPSVEAGPAEEEPSAVLFHQPQPVVEPVSAEDSKTIEEEERLIFGGIVNADYLSFDKKLDELRAESDKAAPAQSLPAATAEEITAIPQAAAQPAPDNQEVSRYDDDTMPYTFMWWLNKTRKEHAETLRPYATEAPKGKHAKIGNGSELQQQYYENIFSLTSVSGVERDTANAGVAFNPDKKEDVIIERFIHTEPQIKPLSADKLDNENKAKKSSEDLNDFVTETLARIYTDQMLYHKAIATYKKLIVKFPEKKLYFAAQIEQLEKKTN
ncbi:hypothetical protein [Mucilaginibacter phyllosphaerae]|uniref:Tetratricopeptide repeat protein n=1 Tax=Mucilaginibacter phyllosphaerae TaxID=1812349 RepID=A0A4Y8AA55_9SPHI|nr:hypothetical protein [Mucilaginibacter phyllosphaerae]MBB3969935.1 hypothetical protein [Mucilaginibacter phyllosphaerae]TEW65306.1 hypothetical protein E2R65_15460 [Mucilaginibacter phyllosphaerae]GGH16695.1 hypothetical protein GCM10007352_26290 [Mucilaginibacter phyllosphaerae]